MYKLLICGKEVEYKPSLLESWLEEALGEMKLPMTKALLNEYGEVYIYRELFKCFPAQDVYYDAVLYERQNILVPLGSDYRQLTAEELENNLAEPAYEKIRFIFDKSMLTVLYSPSNIIKEDDQFTVMWQKEAIYHSSFFCYVDFDSYNTLQVKGKEYCKKAIYHCGRDVAKYFQWALESMSELTDGGQLQIVTK